VVEEEEEYLVATEPEFLEMQKPDKRGSEEDMDEDMEVLRLPKRRHTEPGVEVESGVEASRWMEEPFLEPGEDEYDVVMRELHNEYDAYLPEPPPQTTFERPKGKGKGLMVSEFLLPWGRLNLRHLAEPDRQRLNNLGVPTDATVIFEYGAAGKGYWDGEDLLQQVTEKAFPIAQALYPGYEIVWILTMLPATACIRRMLFASST
jgi:hypothetical protein